MGVGAQDTQSHRRSAATHADPCPPTEAPISEAPSIPYLLSGQVRDVLVKLAVLHAKPP